MALALAAPDFVHAAMHLNHRSDHPAPAYFLLQYLDFGFLFQTADYAPFDLDPPLLAILALAVAAGALALLGTRAKAAMPAVARPEPLPFSRLALAAATGAALALWLASMADRRRSELAVIAILPVLCLWLPGLAALARSLLDRWLPSLTRWLQQTGPFGLLLAMLGLAPPLVFMALSIKLDALVPRAFLPFTPFYLLLTAAGLAHVARGRAAWHAAVAAESLLFLGSAAYFHARPQGPQDYRGAAAVVSREQQPGDVILVRKENWTDTPIFYYLRNADYLTDEQAAMLAARRPPRVWLFEWLDANGAVRLDRRHQVLATAGYVEQRFWRRRGARATLFTPSGVTLVVGRAGAASQPPMVLPR